jgi:hypothetical protein
MLLRSISISTSTSVIRLKISIKKVKDKLEFQKICIQYALHFNSQKRGFQLIICQTNNLCLEKRRTIKNRAAYTIYNRWLGAQMDYFENITMSFD